MNKRKEANLLHGAAALAGAGIIVKIIGAFYKIPLGAMLGPVGMANFSIAYSIYSLLFVIATAGVPTAVSKMVAESVAEGNQEETNRIFSVSRGVFSALGLSGFIIMFLFAEQISNLMGSADCAPAIRSISPAVFFVSILAVCRGYFQGYSDMYPTSVSEITEAAGKLVFGIGAALFLKGNGADDSIIAAGAVSGVTVGAFLSVVFFSFKLKGRGRSIGKGRKKVIRRLLSLSVPITLGAAVISLTAVIDSALVINILKKSGVSEYSAKWYFGAYSYASTLFSLPSSLFATLATAVVPAIASHKAKNHGFEIDKLVNSGIRLSCLVASLAAFGMGAISDGVITVLFGRGIDDECINLSARLLRSLCIGIIPLSLVTITNAVHQAMGRANIPVISIMCGGIVKLLSNYILISIPEINIYGAAISTVLCYITAAVINIAALSKYSYIGIDRFNSLLKPVFAGVLVCIVAGYTYKRCYFLFNVYISTLISVFAGVIVGITSATLTKCVSKYDKNLLFGRKNIFKFMEND